MQPKLLALLEAVDRSCRYIIEDTAGVPVDEYLRLRQVRQAVERNLEIVGQALWRLRDLDPETASLVDNIQQIIGLRNRLAHGYDDEIDDVLIWQVTQASVPALRDNIARILAGIGKSE